MILSDEVVLLRAIEEEDAKALQVMINDPEIESAVVGFSYPVSYAQQKNWILNLNNDKVIRYAIDNRNEFIGMISVSELDWKNKTANINIKLMKEFRGKGYAGRACKLLIKYCFDELNLNCIAATVLEMNSNSNKLWERLGFVKDGCLRKRVYKNGKYHNLISYSYLREEYNERNW